MTAGQAHGRDREYQETGRDILMFRDATLTPWVGDGIDVTFATADTKWTMDVALRSGDRLVVAECRRRTAPVKQDDMAAFAYKVEILRQSLNVEVAGVFITKLHHQIGAVRVGQFQGIDVVVVEEGAEPPGFNITFMRYDAERERACRDIIMHVPCGSIAITGADLTMTHVIAAPAGEIKIGG